MDRDRFFSACLAPLKLAICVLPTKRATHFRARVSAALKLVFFQAGVIFRGVALTIEIPDEAVEAMRMPAAQVETELKKELALALYARSALSLGKAVEMAGVTRSDFEQLLCSRHVERPYSEEDLADDLKFARGFSKEK